jgi:SAM-dependent methyltransferase
MKPNKDAYGQEIWAYFKGKRSFEIAERDDGFIEVTSGPQSYFKEYKDWPEQEKKAIKLVRGRVLDIGCGAGRHSLYLQNKGFDVLGIDNSPLAIKVCKLRGLKKVKIMSITQIDKFKPNSFDTIIMMCANFGLFGSPKRAKTLLKKFYKITSPNALIIADTRDPYKTNKPAHLTYHKFNKKQGRMPGQVRIRIRFEKCIGEWFDYLFVSKKELKGVLKGTGWKVKKFIDSKGTPYAAIIEKINYLKKGGDKK